jgi:hypothetical protein
MENQQQKLAIFDFDGTLANTPTKPQGWKGKDWWGHEDSLHPELFDGSLNPEVEKAFREAKADPNTRVILATGRRNVIAPKVRTFLQAKNLFGRRMIAPSNKVGLEKKDASHPGENSHDSHEEYFSGDQSTEPDFPVYGKKNNPDTRTISHKLYVFNKVINNNIQQIDIWEDRSDHIPYFIEYFVGVYKKWPNVQQITLHRVYANEGGWIQHIPIKPNSTW